MHSNYTDYTLRTINRNELTNQWHHVGQDDKGWSALVMPLADWTGSGGLWWWEWGWTLSWVRWSVRSDPAIVLTRKGYKEHHWLVIPPSTTLVIPSHITTTKCLPLLILSAALSTILVSAAPLSVFAAKLAIVQMLVGPLLLSCSMRRSIK